MVRDMANILLAQHGNQQVGEKWVYNLVRRCPELQLRFSRSCNYERAKCEDRKIIRRYFDSIRQAILECGILPEDI